MARMATSRRKTAKVGRARTSTDPRKLDRLIEEATADAVAGGCGVDRSLTDAGCVTPGGARASGAAAFETWDFPRTRRHVSAQNEAKARTRGRLNQRMVVTEFASIQRAASNAALALRMSAGWRTPSFGVCPWGACGGTRNRSSPYGSSLRLRRSNLVG